MLLLSDHFVVYYYKYYNLVTYAKLIQDENDEIYYMQYITE